MWPVPLAVCQVFTFPPPLLAVEGGVKAPRSEARPARWWHSPPLRSLRTPRSLGIALGRGQHIQGASPWTPLNFPPSVGRRIGLSPVSGTWQCLAAPGWLWRRRDDTLKATRYLWLWNRGTISEWRQPELGDPFAAGAGGEGGADARALRGLC